MKGIDARDSVLACATEIHKSLGRLKNPGFIKDMAAEVTKIQSQTVWEKKGQCLTTAKEGFLIVNNIWK